MADIIVNGVVLSNRNNEVEGYTNKKEKQELIKDIVGFCSFKKGNQTCFEFKDEQTLEDFNKVINNLIRGKSLRRNHLLEFKGYIKEQGYVHLFTSNSHIQGDVPKGNYAQTYEYKIITIESCKRG